MAVEFVNGVFEEIGKHEGNQDQLMVAVQVPISSKLEAGTL
jgi:hypothetical protein